MGSDVFVQGKTDNLSTKMTDSMSRMDHLAQIMTVKPLT